MKLTLKERIRGLELILEDGSSKDGFVSREYVIEKLQKIREDQMSFHPLIEKALLQIRKTKKL